MHGQRDAGHPVDEVGEGHDEEQSPQRGELLPVAQQAATGHPGDTEVVDAERIEHIDEVITEIPHALIRMGRRRPDTRSVDSDEPDAAGRLPLAWQAAPGR